MTNCIGVWPVGSIEVASLAHRRMLFDWSWGTFGFMDILEIRIAKIIPGLGIGWICFLLIVSYWRLLPIWIGHSGLLFLLWGIRDWNCWPSIHVIAILKTMGYGRYRSLSLPVLRSGLERIFVIVELLHRYLVLQR